MTITDGIKRQLQLHFSDSTEAASQDQGPDQRCQCNVECVSRSMTILNFFHTNANQQMVDLNDQIIFHTPNYAMEI